MSNIRLNALAQVASRRPVEITPPETKISDFFASNVFTWEKMRLALSGDIFEQLQDFVDKGVPISDVVADAVALAMKNWALSKGATHYTHWFQPLTGLTAEKHDSFFDGQSIEQFKGSALSQQEPDASSFPSGGIRNTFEARGYTAWDPTSPAFVYESGGTKTLCIPSIYVSYTGEALDFKTPLLKTEQFLEKAAVAVVNLFDRNVNKVYATLGIEQEYFVIDKALFDARPDLMLTGRTLFGHSPAKGQQLDDHYFGSIPERIQRFMLDFETEALKLGIPVRTRHNEVAPSQFECAPKHEPINLAIDHNQLLIDLMDKVALRHQLKILLHEKPFEGVNGSGKHNNWSLCTDTGKNLLAPSSRPKENLVFLTFFINTIKAVHDYADLLRASVASASNDHRLGANEAPPAIMSVFIGQKLTAILNELEKNNSIKLEKGDNLYLKLGISKIPPILVDNTDRNRTSPFAFTGSKFEFRAVGSSANVSAPMTVLNTIVANQLKLFKEAVDKKIEKGSKVEVAVIEVLREYIKTSKNILFEGNNYSEEWLMESKKRGLSNIKTTPEALSALTHKKNIKVFVDNGILSEKEILARYDILIESYIKKIEIERKVMSDLASNHVIPTALTYQNMLIDNVRGLKDIGLGEYATTTVQNIKNISEHLTQLQNLVNKMHDAHINIRVIERNNEKAMRYTTNVKDMYFEKIRNHVDSLENTIDDSIWPLLKYRELLFLR